LVGYSVVKDADFAYFAIFSKVKMSNMMEMHLILKDSEIEDMQRGN